MISTIGEARAYGWKIVVRCAWGKRDGMKSIRECVASQELDLDTLCWTRGLNFPITSLETRMKCPTCGSRRVRILFQPPRNSGQARAAAV